MQEFPQQNYSWEDVCLDSLKPNLFKTVQSKQLKQKFTGAPSLLAKHTLTYSTLKTIHFEAMIPKTDLSNNFQWLSQSLTDHPNKLKHLHSLENLIPR